MIVAAALLVLLGLGLFVAGLLTGATALYWACVGACVVAAVLLILVRRRIRRAPAGDAAVRAPAVGPSAPPATGSPERVEAAPPAEAPASTPPPEPPAPRRDAAGSDAGAAAAAPEEGEPPAEEVEVTDLLLVLDLKDEVLVVDEHPRYHLGGCRYVAGRSTFPLPLDEARTDGFTPCGACEPDRHLAEKVRARKQTGNS